MGREWEGIVMNRIRMNKAILFVIISLLVIGIVGCDSNNIDINDYTDDLTDMEFEYIDDNEIERKLANKDKSEHFKVLRRDDAIYVKIADNEHSTGGYSLRVKDIKLMNNIAVISIEKSEPSPGSIVTTAFDQPIIHIRFENSEVKYITVIDQDGKYIREK